MSYAPPRPILKRYLAENEALRAAVIFCYNEFIAAGIPIYAICHAAHVNPTHLETYVTRGYVEYANDPDNYDIVGEKWRAKNNRRYISDENILRLCDYFRIETDLNIKFNPKRYETIGETLARMAEENWRSNTHRSVGPEWAAQNRAYVD